MFFVVMNTRIHHVHIVGERHIVPLLCYIRLGRKERCFLSTRRIAARRAARRRVRRHQGVRALRRRRRVHPRTP